MKGFVLHVGKGNKAIRIPGIRRQHYSLSELLKRYGIQAFFAVLFMMGLVVGAASSRGFDTELFKRLDFLFVTNVEARLGMTPFEIFSSCFVSYFLFIFMLFLFAFSAWGFIAAPVLSVFKGFSVGVSSAFIFAAYGGSGIGFYILAVLPGVVLFLFTLLRYSRDSFGLSLDYARLSVFGGDTSSGLGADLKAFFRRSLYAFMFSGACAVVDMLLWMFFADKFHFY